MTDALAWALVHFVWQGAALAVLAWMLMRLATGPGARYVIGVTTMTAMVVVLGVTFVSLVPDEVRVEPLAAPVTSGRIIPASAEPAVPVAVPDPVPVATPFVLPTTVVLTLWAAGVCLLSLRVLGGWIIARRVARDALSPLAADLQHLAAGVGARLGIRRVVRVVSSSRVAVPVMIGWLRPVVIVPPAAVAGLSPMQLEAILAHEFAHIRRHDYLVNLLQTAVETLLFFHPVVWWLSREIRRERELCCDDLAIRACDRLTYATALSALAHLQPPALALAATDGSLRDRVRRIVASSPSSESAKGGWMAMLPLVLVVLLATAPAFTQTAARPVEVPVVAAPAPAPATTQKPVPVVVAPVKTPAMVVTRPAGQTAPEKAPVRTTDPVMEQLLDEQLAIERRKLALERARLENDSMAELRRLELDVRTSEVGLEDIRKKVATGVQTENVQRNWEYSHQILLTRLQSAKRNLDIGLEALAIREQELALERRMQTAGLLPEGTKISADTITLSGNASLAMYSVERELSPTDTIRAGDRMRVEIVGEDQLPREFTVAENGSIRYPLLGSVRVVGSTVAQVRAALTKLLADRGLAENPRVTVTATR